MDHILVYGDSLTWGIVPDTRRRLPFEARWPGVMEHDLAASGRRVRVIEDCLNGRRTAWDDPFKPGRNGLLGLEQRIEVNSPLALVIIMLGTNDFQSMHQHDAWHSAQGIAALVRAIRRAPIEPGMPVPEILVVAPPPMRTPRGADRAEVPRRRDERGGLAEALCAGGHRRGLSRSSMPASVTGVERRRRRPSRRRPARDAGTRAGHRRRATAARHLRGRRGRRGTRGRWSE